PPPPSAPSACSPPSAAGSWAAGNHGRSASARSTSPPRLGLPADEPLPRPPRDGQAAEDPPPRPPRDERAAGYVIRRVVVPRHRRVRGPREVVVQHGSQPVVGAE